MLSMTVEAGVVVGGVDTHSEIHRAAVLDAPGRELGDGEFPATTPGYQALLGWLQSFGELMRVGVEGTSSYGAGLLRHLRAAGVVVAGGGPPGPADPSSARQVRPDRRLRRRPHRADRRSDHGAQGRGRDRRGHPGAAGAPP